jgi:hypothetical protein
MRPAVKPNINELSYITREQNNMNTNVLKTLFVVLLSSIFIAHMARADSYVNEPVPREIAEPDPRAIWTVPVVVIRFIPKSADGKFLDPSKAPGFYEPGEVLYNEKKTELDAALLKTHYYRQEGTKFRAYKFPDAAPSITYPVVAIYTCEDLPPASQKFYVNNKNGVKVPFPDWFKVMRDINGKSWVNEKGVKEFWIWSTDYAGTEPSYDSNLIPKRHFRALAESNMASRFGDVSNSTRADDLPLYSQSYTVYQFNLLRSVNENIHNHIHQVEHLLNHIEGRDETAKDKWNELLFWGKFVGSDFSHNLTEPRRAGWCHFPPNANKGYDYTSETTVFSDIEDWTPDASGEFKPINANRWGRIEAEWHLLWMQSLPGRDNGLKYKNRSVENWWYFVGNWDGAMREKAKLVK